MFRNLCWVKTFILRSFPFRVCDYLPFTAVGAPLFFKKFFYTDFDDRWRH